MQMDGWKGTGRDVQNRTMTAHVWMLSVIEIKVYLEKYQGELEFHVTTPLPLFAGKLKLPGML